MKKLFLTFFWCAGSSVQKIGQTSLASKQIPLLMYAGEVISATSGGQLTQLVLSTHDSSQNDKDQSVLETNFTKQIALHRFHAAWQTCELLNSEVFWRKLASESMKHLELDFAIRAFKLLEDVSMVWSLESLNGVEDSKLLCGYISMFLNDFNKAQEWFLGSSYPVAALEMRRDLLQWDQALQLSKKMAPDQIAQISREYAQQLEFTYVF